MGKIKWIDNDSEKNGYVPSSVLTYTDPSHREVYLKDTTGQYAKYIFNNTSPELIDSVINDKSVSINPDESKNEAKETNKPEKDLIDKANPDESSELALKENEVTEENYEISTDTIINVICFVMIIIIAIILLGVGGES